MSRRGGTDGAARRFLSRETLAGAAEFNLETDAAHKIARVLRLAPGDTVRVLDREGVEYRAEILACDRSLCRLRRLDVLVHHDPPLPVRIAMPVIKGERMDWAVEKIAETGVSSLLLLDVDRALTGEVSPEKISRWTRIAEAACLQSMGGRPLSISDQTLALDSILSEEGTKWHLDPRGRRAMDALSSRPGIPLTILVGPEGGWSEGEEEKLSKTSVAVSLGNRILRAETAGVTAALLGSLIISKAS